MPVEVLWQLPCPQACLPQAFLRLGQSQRVGPMQRVGLRAWRVGGDEKVVLSRHAGSIRQEVDDERDSIGSIQHGPGIAGIAQDDVSESIVLGDDLYVLAPKAAAPDFDGCRQRHLSVHTFGGGYGHRLVDVAVDMNLSRAA